MDIARATTSLGNTTMGKRSREKRERRLMGESGPEKGEFKIGAEKICKPIILIGTCLILFTPLIVSAKYFFPFVGPKSLYFMGLAEIIFFTWIFLAIFNPRYRPRLNPLSMALILFLLVLIFAAIFGVDPSYSFWSKFERMSGILMMLHLLAFFLVISTVFEKSDWNTILAISVLAGIIISVIALFFKSPSMRSGATIGNDSFLGTYLLFNLFLALYLILKSQFGLKFYASIGFLIMAGTLFLSGARAAKISFLGGLILLFFLWMLIYKKGKLRTIGISFLALFIISAFCFTFFAFQPGSFAQKVIKVVVEKNFGGSGGTFGGRFIVWEVSWKSFLQRPLLGWGSENFEFAFTKNYNSCLGTVRCAFDIWYDRAHNIVFDTLVSSGILGLLSYVGIFIAAFWLLWRNYFKGKLDFYTCGIFTALLISYPVQNLTVFDMVSSYMVFFLVLGFIAAAPKEPRESQTTKYFNYPRLLVVTILLVMFCFSFIRFVIQPLKTDAYVIEAFAASPLGDRISLYQKALDTSPVGRHQIREFFADQFLNFVLQSLQNEEIKNVPAEKIRAEFDFLSRELEKSIKESPLDYRAYLKLGQTYNLYSRFDPTKLPLAETVLEKTISLSPANQSGYWALAQTRLYQGQTQEALLLVQKAVELEEDLARSHLIVAQVAMIAGDYDLAKKEAREAMEIDPSLDPSTIKSILGEL